MAFLLLRRSFPRLATTSTTSATRYASIMATSNTPLEDAIRTKLTAALSPRTLEIYNDSHKHAHHSAMRGVTDKKETHFR